MVQLLSRYSNQQELYYSLKRRTDKLKAAAASSPDADALLAPRPAKPSLSPWSLRDRLSAEDVQALIWSFQEGAPAWKFAEKFNISVTSVKKLLREHGARRRRIK